MLSHYLHTYLHGNNIYAELSDLRRKVFVADYQVKKIKKELQETDQEERSLATCRLPQEEKDDVDGAEILGLNERVKELKVVGKDVDREENRIIGILSSSENRQQLCCAMITRLLMIRCFWAIYCTR